jgi:predicted nucleotidyltransferase
VLGSLSALQVRVLRALAGLSPRWTLTGGGALAGFYLAHRQTKDVDLFFHGISALERLPEDAAAALRAEGMSVDFLQRAPTFCRLRAGLDGEVVVVDLVAEAVPNVFPPEARSVEAVEILVDSRTEILVNKLGALYSRSEIRDLVDVKALVDAGENLDAALGLVSRKDGGFSPPDLAWVLRNMRVSALAKADGYDAVGLLAFREQLVERLLG